MELGTEYVTTSFLQALPGSLHPYIRRPIAERIPYTDKHRNPITKSVRTIVGVLLSPYILFRNVLVKDKQIALVWANGEAEIYGPGRHALFSPTTRVFKIVSINNPVINHGNMTIVRVEAGQLGYGLDTETGDPVLLTPGKHFINQSTFEFKSFLDLTAAQNSIGKLLLLRVETGSVGYYYKNGTLELLEPGKLHLISPPDRFGGFLSTQQQVLDLPTSTHESSDYVELTITASLFYRIVDAQRALTVVNDILKQVRETAIATLAGIIRSTTLAEIAQNSTPSYKSEDSANPFGESGRPEPYAPSAPPFYEKVHDMFLGRLHDHVLKDWGIEISNIRIESLKIRDGKLADNIAKQAVTVSQMEVKYNMLQKQAEITETEARIASEAQKIQAHADASAQQIKADADAAAVLALAKAKKNARELEGQGELAYAQSVSSTKIGPMLAQLKLQAQAMEGMKQIAYLPEGCIPKLLTQGMFGNGSFNIPEVPDS